MGLLGSNFVRAMLKRGVSVQVWNRTASRAATLEQYGAKAFSDPADAVRQAAVIHLTLKDDASVDEVLENAKAGFAPGAIIIDHTTISVPGAIERTREWKQRGFTYLHAPVFMGPQNALEGTGYMLVSGDQDFIAKAEPNLAKMTGKVINFGAEPGRAAGMKLIGNCFLISFTAGIADTLSLAKALDIPVSNISTLFDSWNPGAMLPAPDCKGWQNGNYLDQPSWGIEYGQKRCRPVYGCYPPGRHHKLAVIPAIAAEMDRWIEKGYGEKDWAVIAKDAVQVPTTK